MCGIDSALRESAVISTVLHFFVQFKVFNNLVYCDFAFFIRLLFAFLSPVGGLDISVKIDCSGFSKRFSSFSIKEIISSGLNVLTSSTSSEIGGG